MIPFGYQAHGTTPLRYIVAVAEELKFRQTATRLYLSETPLSRQIDDLEDEVGTKLFARSQSGMRLATFFRSTAHRGRNCPMSLFSKTHAVICQSSRSGNP